MTPIFKPGRLGSKHFNLYHRGSFTQFYQANGLLIAPLSLCHITSFWVDYLPVERQLIGYKTTPEENELRSLL
jgi:hypothetical protein